MKRLSISINRINDLFWSRVVTSSRTSVESLCVFRILVGLFLLFVHGPNYGWIGSTPKVFFGPPVSIALFFNTFPSTDFFLTVDIFILIAAIFITIGIKAKISTIVYSILNLIALSFQFSFGKIDHNILLYAMLLCLSFSNWGTHLALIPDKKEGTDRHLKSLSLFAVIICFAFFTAGFNKAIHWINFDLSKNGTGYWFYNGLYGLEREHLLAPYAKAIPFWWFKVSDFICVAFELTPIFFLLYSRKVWHVWLLMAAMFHFVNLLVLNIPFIAYSIIYLTFVDFSPSYTRIKYLINKKSFAVIGMVGLSIVFLTRLYYIFDLQLVTSLFIPEFLLFENLIAAFFIWMITLFFLSRNAFKNKRVSPNL